MQSVTSYFNKTLFRHNLVQFWPLWFGYTLVWLFISPIALFTELSRGWFTPAEFEVAYRVVVSGVSGGIFMAAAFALLFAMAMFSYLCVPRATLGLHAMPARRETLFVTSYLSGLFCLVSTLVLTFAFTGIVTASYGWWDAQSLLTALLSAALSVIFFYSFGVLCIVMTGQILAAPVFYVIGNVLVAGMELLLRTFAGNFLFGYSNSIYSRFGFLSPAYYIVTNVEANVRSKDITDAAGNYVRTVQTGWDVEGFGILAAYAVAGVVLAALALWLYRRRKSEMTGSTVAFAWAAPIFKYGVSFCTAIALGQLVYYILFGQHLDSGEYSLAGTLVCMVITGLLGYYAAEMLNKKSVHIFKSSLRGAVAMTLVLIALGVSMTFDLTGYEHRIPKVDEVKDIYISFAGATSFDTEDPEEIAKIIAAHRAVVEHKDEILEKAQVANNYNNYFYNDSFYNYSENRMLYLTISYVLKNGTTVERHYDVVISREELKDIGSVTQAINEAYTCDSAVFSRILGQYSSAEKLENLRFTGGYYNSYEERPNGERYSTTLTAEQAEQLYAALGRDVQTLKKQPSDIFTYYEMGVSAWVELYAGYTNEKGLHDEKYYNVEVYENMEQTIECLKGFELTNKNEAANDDYAYEEIIEKAAEPKSIG